jgi:DNA repair ATPase RecN
MIVMSDGHVAISRNPDDLRDASRERLLAEIGRLHHQYEINIKNMPALLQHVAELEMELLQNRDYVRGLSAEVGELTARLHAANRQLHQARQETKRLQQSRTWKIGRMILLPVRVLRRLLK